MSRRFLITTAGVLISVFVWSIAGTIIVGNAVGILIGAIGGFIIGIIVTNSKVVADRKIDLREDLVGLTIGVVSVIVVLLVSLVDGVIDGAIPGVILDIVIGLFLLGIIAVNRDRFNEGVRWSMSLVFLGALLGYILGVTGERIGGQIRSDGESWLRWAGAITGLIIGVMLEISGRLIVSRLADRK